MNRVKFSLLWEFQTLIGRLVAKVGLYARVSTREFQTLIGRLVARKIKVSNRTTMEISNSYR